jgi:hypothetical protein
MNNAAHSQITNVFFHDPSEHIIGIIFISWPLFFRKATDLSSMSLFSFAFANIFYLFLNTHVLPRDMKAVQSHEGVHRALFVSK